MEKCCTGFEKIFPVCISGIYSPNQLQVSKTPIYLLQPGLWSDWELYPPLAILSLFFKIMQFAYITRTLPELLFIEICATPVFPSVPE